MADAVDWVQQKVPGWLMIIMAGIGTPTAIGSAIWQQNNEPRIQALRDDIADLRHDHDRLWAEMALRVRTTERLEMLAELNRRLNSLEARMDRVQGYNNLEGPR